MKKDKQDFVEREVVCLAKGTSVLLLPYKHTNFNNPKLALQSWDPLIVANNYQLPCPILSPLALSLSLPIWTIWQLHHTTILCKHSFELSLSLSYSAMLVKMKQECDFYGMVSPDSGKVNKQYYPPLPPPTYLYPILPSKYSHPPKKE